MISWARYLHWADLARKRFYDYISAYSPEHDSPRDDACFFALMSHWYASLYVVIEGWTSLKLADSLIDQLLAERSSTLKLLKRYRNGVFHYQRSLMDSRFLDVMTSGERVIDFICLLHLEFLRYLWQVPDSLGGTTEQNIELRHLMSEALGWWPEHTPHAQEAELRALANEAIALSYTGTDPNDKNAQTLREEAMRTLAVADRYRDKLALGFEAMYRNHLEKFSYDRGSNDGDTSGKMGIPI